MRDDQDPWDKLGQKAGVVASLHREARKHERHAEDCQASADRAQSDLVHGHDEHAAWVNRQLAAKLRRDAEPVIAEARRLIDELFPKEE